ncbi:MAG: arylamine N-acetyltransferase [Defluviitaleaceae bacterium]|nr:arylamine N-acetyltransferase [Defluviitaleaceae bacterium]
MELKPYLTRIGVDGIAKNDLQTLNLLQHQHLKTVPYENLDIMRNIPISLEVADIYEKIVIRNRGGYCFELNGLFAWLLKTLGFAVVDYMARYLRDEPTIPMRRHRVLRVTCNGKDFLCDVGVGAVVPRTPLPFIFDTPMQRGNEVYKLEKEPFLGNVLYERKKHEWSAVYAFTEEEQLDLDYIMPSFYCEKHPESFFRTMDMVHIFTEDGRKSVANREIKLFSPNNVEVITPQSEEHYNQLLLEHFQIKI